VADAATATEIANYLEDDMHRVKIEQALDANIDVWLSGVEIALEDFANMEALPNKILLCGGGAGLVRLQESLATKDWWDELSFSRRPIIHLLDDIDIPGIENITDVDLDYSYITAFGLLRVALDTLSGAEESMGLRAKIAKILQN
jgi:cell division protein FtsA